MGRCFWGVSPCKRGTRGGYSGGKVSPALAALPRGAGYRCWSAEGPWRGWSPRGGGRDAPEQGCCRRDALEPLGCCWGRRPGATRASHSTWLAGCFSYIYYLFFSFIFLYFYFLIIIILFGMPCKRDILSGCLQPHRRYSARCKHSPDPRGVVFGGCLSPLPKQ